MSRLLVSISLAMTRICRSVISVSARAGRASASISSVTVDRPDHSAPNTKKGGYSVECQPGVAPPAKSSPTTQCTETTRGAISAARRP